MKKILIKSRRMLFFLLGVAMFLIISMPVFAEGTLELNKNGGPRMLISNHGYYDIPVTQFLYAYAESGETIYFGTSQGNIRMTDPSGNTSAFTVSGNYGLINTIAKEKGPNALVSGGYLPFVFNVSQTGLYIFELSGNPNYWDVTVSRGSSRQPGRVFSYYLQLQNPDGTGLLSSIYVLTSDGYIYSINFNGIMTYAYFLFFASNRGLINSVTDTSFNHTTKNLNGNDFSTFGTLAGNIIFKSPMIEKQGLDTAYKLFFNTPSADLLEYLDISAPRPINPISNFQFNRGEGIAAVGQGGIFTFECSEEGGSYQIELGFGGDSNRTVYLSSTQGDGVNIAYWNGKDAQGNIIPAGSYTARIRLKRGEYHFPFLDAENNPNGVKVRLENVPGYSKADYVYYDNSDIRVNGVTLDLANGANNTDSRFTGSVKRLDGVPSYSEPAMKYTDSWGDYLFVDIWTYYSGSNDTVDIPYRLIETTDYEGWLSGFVFFDADKSGRYAIEDGDYGLGMVPINIFDNAGNVVASTITAANGRYFVKLPYSSMPYKVVVNEFDLPSTTNNQTQTNFIINHPLVSASDVGFFVDLATKTNFTFTKSWIDTLSEHSTPGFTLYVSSDDGTSFDPAEPASLGLSILPSAVCDESACQITGLPKYFFNSLTSSYKKYVYAVVEHIVTGYLPPVYNNHASLALEGDTVINQKPVKKVNKTGSMPYGELTYSIEYSNYSQSAQRVVFADQVPPHTTFISASGTDSPYITSPTPGQNGNVTWTYTDLEPGEKAVVTLVVKVDSKTTEAIVNSGSVSINNQPAVISNPVTTTITPLSPVNGSFSVTKYMDSYPFEDKYADEFEFSISCKASDDYLCSDTAAAEGSSFTSKNDGNGLVVFDGIQFSDIGEYVFEIQEVQGSKMYVYDTSRYYVKIPVTVDIETDNKSTLLVGTPIFFNSVGEVIDSVVFNNLSLLDYTIRKTWRDTNNYDGIRPANITLQLYADGAPIRDIISLPYEGKWEYTWEDLPSAIDAVTPIIYSVREVDLSLAYYYKVSVEESDPTYTHAVVRNTQFQRMPQQMTVVKKGDHDGKIVRSGDILSFQIDVTNTADYDLQNVSLRDYIPEYTSLVLGETRIEGVPRTGDYVSTIYDDEGNEMRVDWNLATLLAGETRTVCIQLVVTELPANEAVTIKNRVLYDDGNDMVRMPDDPDPRGTSNITESYSLVYSKAVYDERWNSIECGTLIDENRDKVIYAIRVTIPENGQAVISLKDVVPGALEYVENSVRYKLPDGKEHRLPDKTAYLKEYNFQGFEQHYVFWQNIVISEGTTLFWFTTTVKILNRMVFHLKVENEAVMFEGEDTDGYYEYPPSNRVEFFVTKEIDSPSGLPQTGFPPEKINFSIVSDVHVQENSAVRMSIPAIGTNAPVLGVPYEERNWDTAWLGNNIGLLEYKTNIGATERGNILFSGHNTNYSGAPGVFAGLHLLRSGDLIQVFAYGEVFTYRVYEYYETAPDDISPLNDSDKPIITLISCRYWDEDSSSYSKRVVVKAELLSGE